MMDASMISMDGSIISGDLWEVHVKRVLKWLGLVVLVLLLAVGAVIYSAFAPNRPIVDGQALGDGTVQTIKDGFVSVYLLAAGGGKVALIDAGKDRDGAAIMAALRRRGLTPAAVSAIFLTHGHSDHTAAASRFPAASIHALPAEQALLGDSLRITHPVRDGQVIDVGNQHVEVFAVPGHTAGSAVFLAAGTLFFGDSAGAGKDGAMMPAVRWFSRNPAENIAQLKALALRLKPRAAQVKTLAFAHTGPLDGFEQLERFGAQH
jgi:glyoxylase-like metal-dependent hydrolase (beta-lactamase superfamily II)